MDLQAQYQTFFTGIVVLGAVMLDIYRTKKSTEVRILSASDRYRQEMLFKLSQLQGEEAAALKVEMNKEYRRLRREEKLQRAALRKQEKEFEKS